MTTGLSVLESVYTLLKKNTDLTNKIQDRMFPLIAKENTKNPFIVYQRESLEVNYCKDGIGNENTTVSINIVCDTYTESVELAEIVRKSLELKRIDNIKSIRLVSSNEDFIDDSYLQELRFEINY